MRRVMYENVRCGGMAGRVGNGIRSSADAEIAEHGAQGATIRRKRQDGGRADVADRVGRRVNVVAAETGRTDVAVRVRELRGWVGRGEAADDRAEPLVTEEGRRSGGLEGEAAVDAVRRRRERLLSEERRRIRALRGRQLARQHRQRTIG